MQPEQKLLLAFVFKGHLDLRPVGLDLAFSDLHVEFDNFGDAKVSQTLRSTFYSCACSLFPGVGAGADQFDNLITLSAMASSVVTASFRLSLVVAEAIARPISNRPATAIQADRRAAFASLISIFFNFGSPPLDALFKSSNSSTRKFTSLSMSGTAVRQAISPKSRLSK